MDREKIIAWLADEELYYRDHGNTHNSLMACNALAMLKEQEAVKPTWNRGKPFCGACGLRIHGRKFCSECGKRIEWEGR